MIILTIIAVTNILQLVYFWSLQPANNTKYTNVVDEILKNSVNYETHFQLAVKLAIYIHFIILNFFWINFDDSTNNFCENFRINNFISNVVELNYLLNVLICLIFCNFKKFNFINKLVYTYSILFILCVVPIIFFLNNLYVFFFYIELVNILFFFKFISSRSWENNLTVCNEFNFLKKNGKLSQQYNSTIFFQYWNSFFSSLLLFLAITYFTYTYGTTNKSELGLINYEINFFETANNFFWNLFIFSLALKFGMTPLHLYKVEVYKGLNIISVFFYTVYLFLFFSQYVIYIYNYFFSKLILQSFSFISICLYLGLLYIIFMLFSNKSLKTLFALSTLLNVLTVIWSLYIII